MWFRFFLLVIFTLILGVLLTIFLTPFISPDIVISEIDYFGHFVLIPIQSIACFYQILDLLYSDSEAFKSKCRKIEYGLLLKSTEI